ncbi:plasmid partitioning protein RepB [Rhizobium sp. PL01]|uniref:plasmid partitioning protein RepB n=1 Tax=Rhizobium sp. PL01 TaxID=3085631 RepID=UPI0029821449|nr:plasmid partitioning protein RepB [Rhizobium sp. PL01]MDW5318340.1 plasmid partitioning protein RepB [Rhizobium sp. PL01]
MARKNFLAGLVDVDVPLEQEPTSYPMRGASKTMIRSIDEMAKQADRFLEGEAIVELEPDQVDGSFISDRLDDDQAEFEALVEAIKAQGQNTPILVRPHASIDDRYQVVFGHRRLKAAKALGLKVRAVVKQMDDRTHVIAQGQENSARANLTFIERALFARRLDERGYDREVISAALATNAASLSKMMTVTERIPSALISAIGAAPAVGRERWIELSLLVGKASSADKIDKLKSDATFLELRSDDRFTVMLNALNKTARPVKKTELPANIAKWQPVDKAVAAEIKNTGKSFSLSMKAKNASRFGNYLSSKLDVLYAQFLDEEQKHGD